MHLKLICFLLFLQLSLFSEKIDTFYGPLDINEPVLLELIESPAFQRLKSIHQYGVAYYTTHREEYSRYDHCLGVLAVLRLHHASLEEQISGLLHDVSHTVFSHVGDWIFHDKFHDADYQSSIHSEFFEKYGLGQILKKYNYTIESMLPIEEHFPMLEQKSPNLCADRIDYNIQGAFYQNFITRDEAIDLLQDLRFVDGVWVSSHPTLMAKVARFSLHMTLGCWGSVQNYLSSRFLADAILQAIQIKLISFDDIHFGSDQKIWNILSTSSDSKICKLMHQVNQTQDCFYFVDHENADIIIKSKFRGINPWIFHEGKKMRLTEVDSHYREEYERTKKLMEKGWAIKLTQKS